MGTNHRPSLEECKSAGSLIDSESSLSLYSDDLKSVKSTSSRWSLGRLRGKKLGEKKSSVPAELFERTRNEWDQEKEKLVSQLEQTRLELEGVRKREEEYIQITQAFLKSVLFFRKDNIERLQNFLDSQISLRNQLLILVSAWLGAQILFPKHATLVGVGFASLIALLLLTKNDPGNSILQPVSVPAPLMTKRKDDFFHSLEQSENKVSEEKKSNLGNNLLFGTAEYEAARVAHVQSQVALLDKSQLSALETMRQEYRNTTCREIEQNAGSFKIDDATLLRFLRARNFDIEKAKKMFSTHLEWREKFAPGLIRPQDAAKAIRSGSTRLSGTSLNGEPIVLVQLKYFHPAEFEDIDEFIQSCAFFFEKQIQIMPPHIEKGLVFFDMNGFSISKHWNAKAVKIILAFVKVIQDHNPERLRRLMLFNTPRAFQLAWKVIRKFLDPGVEEKVCFVRDLAVLREEIDPSNLMERYGGDRVDEYPVVGMEEL